MNLGMRSLGMSLVVFVLLATPMAGRQDKTTAATDRHSKSELRKIYDEDQRNRNDVEGDAKRREQVRKLVAEGKVQSGEDFYYAAFIFQHGQQPADYLYAHVLAVTAVSKGLHEAIWLSAASLDRYLSSIKQPQIFGTQFGNSFSNSDDQEPYDKMAVSDSLRALWCVAPYSTQAKILNDLKAGKAFVTTRTCPLPESQLDQN